jgi:4-aminobutyrate aminotransferase-like enzyme
MIGIEFVRNGMEPDSEGLKKVILSCREKGLIILECGVDKNIIRLAPPLIVTKEEMDRGLDIFEEAINKTKAGC